MADNQENAHHAEGTPHIESVGHLHIGDVHDHHHVYYPEQVTSTMFPNHQFEFGIKQEQKEVVKASIGMSPAADLGHPVCPVQLQITQNIQACPEETGYINETNRKIRLLEHTHQSVGDINMKDLFKKSREKATAESQQKCDNEASKQKYVEKHGNVVGVTGIVGVGKTTLTKMMLEQILDGRIIPDASYVFYLILREIDFDQKTTLFDLLFSSIPEMLGLDCKQKNQVMLKIQKDPNVVIFIDGLDDVDSSDLSKKFPTITLLQKSQPMSLIVNLISGTLLPLAFKLVTSRPRQLINMHVDHRPNFVVEILGLDEASQDQLGQQICGDNFQQVKKKLHQSPQLLENCTIPVNFILILIYLTENPQTQSGLIAITDVFISVLNKYIRSSHLATDDIGIKNLIDLAWEGFLQNKFMFSEEDLTEAGLTHSMLQAFINTSIARSTHMKMPILRRDKKSFFTHRTWQELLVAVKLVLMLPGSDFRNYVSLFLNPQWENVTKFVFGLCRHNTHEKAKQLLPNTSYAGGLSSKRLFLAAHIDSTMNNINNQINLFASGQDITVSSFWLQAILPQFFHLCGCVKELHDQEITKFVACQLPKSLSLFGFLFPSDVSNMFFVIESLGQPFAFNYVSGTFVGDSLASFASYINATKSKIFIFSPFCNHPLLNDEAKAVASCIKQIVAIHLPPQSEPLLQEIQRKLRTTNQTLPCLGVENRAISENEFDLICRCIHGIKTLVISGCGVNSSKAQKLSRSMIQSDTMTGIELSSNPIGDQAAQKVCLAFHDITVIKISGCNLTDKSTADIAKGFKDSNNKERAELHLHTNKIGNDGVRRLAECIPKLHILDLKTNALTCVTPITKKMSTITFMFSELDLSNNNLGDQGADDLAECIHVVKMLFVENCGITKVGAKKLAGKVLLMRNPMQTLALNGNKIEDDGARCYIPCFKNIECLELNNCDVSQSCGYEMSYLLQQNGFPPMRLQFPYLVQILPTGPVFTTNGIPTAPPAVWPPVSETPTGSGQE